jgi:hypothetical protein
VSLPQLIYILPPVVQLTLLNHQAVNSWPPETDIGEWKGTNQNWYNTFNTSSIVKSNLVDWPGDLSFHSLKAVLTAESNGADVKIDFYMDNTLRTTQFGQGFVGKPLWLYVLFCRYYLEQGQLMSNDSYRKGLSICR